MTALLPDDISSSALLAEWRTVREGATAWTPPNRRTVVIAPHPDDEALSSAGLIARQRGCAVEVVVVAVTDGDAAYDADGDATLAETRRDEQRSALDELGVPASSIRHLGLPDGRVAQFERDLVDRLHDIIEPGDLVVAAWEHDVHPDHEACGRAARAATVGSDVALVFSLFWAWHRPSTTRLVDVDLLALHLDDTERGLKQAAVACHTSQFVGTSTAAPILDERSLEPATWPSEFFVLASSEPTR